jgi:hypothetical protein
MSKEQGRLLIIGLVIGLWATSVFALSPQTVWTRTYGGTGGEFGLSVQQTSDGGYIISGVTSSFGAGSEDAYLIKTDASGDTVWTKTYGGTGSEFGNSVQQTSDGGYIVAGEATSFGAGSGDAYLIKTGASGDTVWTRTYGGTGWDDGNSVQQTSDGGYIIVGDTDSFGAGSKDAYLIKTDANGDTLWTGTYGGTEDDTGWSVQQTSDGGYIIGGMTDSFGAGSYDIYLIKTDAGGDTVWTRTYGGTGVELGGSVQQTSDGGYIIGGMTDSFGAGSYDAYLIKTDASGDTVWTRAYGGTGAEGGGSVQQTPDGGYVFAGYTSSFGAGGDDVYLIRTDANGDPVWTRTYGGTGEDAGVLIKQTSNGRYIIAGYTDSFGAGSYDVYLIRVREHSWKAKDVKFGPPAPGPGNREPVVVFSNGASTRFAIHGSTPNPFSQETVIRFDLPVRGEVELSIHDVEGRLVRRLLGEVRPPGSNSVVWDGRDFSGAEVAGGIYFLHLKSGGKVATGKVVVAH